MCKSTVKIPHQSDIGLWSKQHFLEVMHRIFNIIMTSHDQLEMRANIKFCVLLMLLLPGMYLFNYNTKFDCNHDYFLIKTHNYTCNILYSIYKIIFKRKMREMFLKIILSRCFFKLSNSAWMCCFSSLAAEWDHLYYYMIRYNRFEKSTVYVLLCRNICPIIHKKTLDNNHNIT